MRNLAWIALALLIAGCGSQKTVQSTTPEVILTPAAQIPKQPLGEPNFNVTSRLGLVKSTGYVRVGEERASALKVFAPPVGSYDQDDLPPSITDPYVARGWQTNDEGFGLILFDGKVAGAVYELTRASEDRASEIVDTHRNAFGPPSETIAGKYVNYWFWTDKESGQRLMICSFHPSAKKSNVTAAVGTIRIMDALGMSPDNASREQTRVDDALTKQRATKSPKSGN